MTKEIQLTQGKVALVDDEDYEFLSLYTWYVKFNKCGTYAYTQVRGAKRQTVHMHQILMLPDSDKVVDHINGNGLDNRRCNLRVCTQTQNLMNSRRHKNNTSGEKGISFDKRSGEWYAYIVLNKVMKNLGLHKNKDDAIKARKQAEEKYFGEYARK